MERQQTRFAHQIFYSLLILTLCLFNQAFILDTPGFVPPQKKSISEIRSSNRNLTSESIIRSGDPVNETVESKPFFRWALAWWKDSQIACNIYIEATGEPSAENIQNNCGNDILRTWLNTPACVPSAKTGTQKCTGLYLLYMGQVKPDEIANVPKTPIITAQAELVNCGSWENCSSNPQLKFFLEGGNTVNNSHDLYVIVDDDEYHCDNQSCILDMPATDFEGITIKYWTEYSGIVPLIHTFKMRNIVESDDGEVHSFALLGDEWPSPVDTCANAWDMFPESDTLDFAWINKVNSPEELKTDLDYALLAGRLIWNGYVDASGCPDSGLLPNGSADECGMGKAHDMVIEWQNRFNEVITRASEETSVPARLIKGVIAQESQFWPQWPDKPEYGYGMMSENGIDLLLNWNVDYFLKLCNEHYTSDQCMMGYSNLSEDQQRFLRGVCLLSVGTDKEFVLLANMLKASCAQTRQLIKNITEEVPEDVFSYETLWRISLGIYNTGSGCMGEAITYAWHDYESEMSWTDFNRHIPDYCETARTYFDKVVYYGSTALHQAP